MRYRPVADKAYFAVRPFLVVFVVTLVKVNAACTPVQYTIRSANGSSWCVNCPTCPQGQEVYPPCGREISTNDLSECRGCKEGLTFSSHQDVWSCQTCGNCSKDHVVKNNCTISSDTVCAKQCKSSNKYDDDGACMLCSSCCGNDEDVRVKECEQKLGSASNRVCSSHSSHNHCNVTTTAAITTTPSNPSTTPTKGGHVVGSTTVTAHSVLANDDQSSHPNDKLKTTKPAPTAVAGTTGTIILVSVLVFVLFILFAVFFAFWKFKKRGNHTNRDNDRGNAVCHFSQVPTDDPANTNNGQVQVVTNLDESRLKRSDEAQMIRQSKEPLVEKVNEENECSCQNGSFDPEKGSKNIDRLFEDESALG